MCELGKIIALIKKLGGGSGPSVQSDWNQNDSTAADYVKNRPFYTGASVETELVPAQDLTFADQGGIIMAALPSGFSIVDGDTLSVYFDCQKYDVTATLIGGTIPVVGNLSILGAGADTGEPFVILEDGSWFIITNAAVGSHNVKIVKLEVAIQQIEQKYIPIATDDGYGVVKKSEIVTAYKFNDVWAPEFDMKVAVDAVKSGNGKITWGPGQVIYATRSGDDITLVFADEPTKFVTFSPDNNTYNMTLGVHSFNEVSGTQLRLTNSDGYYAVINVKGDSQADAAISTNELRVGLAKITSKSLVLASSTTASTKKFKITVDDTGTISATEV